MAPKTKEGLRAVLLIAGVLGGWLLLQRVLLPMCGVQT